jgi:hypothetical protein
VRPALRKTGPPPTDARLANVFGWQGMFQRDRMYSAASVRRRQTDDVVGFVDWSIVVTLENGPANRRRHLYQ